VQPLVVSTATALARLSEPGPDPSSLVAFFRAVGERACCEARALGLTVLPCIATDTTPPELLAEQVLERLAGRGLGARRRADWVRCDRTGDYGANRDGEGVRSTQRKPSMCRAADSVSLAQRKALPLLRAPRTKRRPGPSASVVHSATSSICSGA
jgi:hypothetical protein